MDPREQNDTIRSDQSGRAPTRVQESMERLG